MNTSEMAKRVLAEADPSKRELWLRETGRLAPSVRLDIPLRQGQAVLHTLRWLANELPNICKRIEREKDEERRLFVAQTELQEVRRRIGRKRHPRN